MHFGYVVVSVLLAIFSSLSAVNAAGLIVLAAISLCIGVFGMLVDCH